MLNACLFIYCYNWVCNTETTNMLETGWHMVFLFSRNFKILSLPKIQPGHLEFEVFAVLEGNDDLLIWGF